MEDFPEMADIDRIGTEYTKEYQRLLEKLEIKNGTGLATILENLTEWKEEYKNLYTNFGDQILKLPFIEDTMYGDIKSEIKTAVAKANEHKSIFITHDIVASFMENDISDVLCIYNNNLAIKYGDKTCEYAYIISHVKIIMTAFQNDVFKRTLDVMIKNNPSYYKYMLKLVISKLGC
jgi:hypothetical protein